MNESVSAVSPTHPQNGSVSEWQMVDCCWSRFTACLSIPTPHHLNALSSF